MSRARAKLFLFMISLAVLAGEAAALPPAKKQLPAVALAPISKLHPGHDLNLNDVIDSTHARTTKLSHRLRTKLRGRSLYLTRRHVHLRHNASVEPAKRAKIKASAAKAPGRTANIRVQLLPNGHH